MAKQIPLRQCIGCRQMKAKSELVRIIKTPDNEICLDKTGKMNGRGAYICLDNNCYNKAVKSKGIEKSLKMAIPEDIYEAIGKELN
ncbi:MAG: YlxR family protein [Lachnospiraceae bacterium]|nr:YlxR family protein [Lachnospiraceae bacterium]MBQ9936016.1 YlxR family protein [Lachnospiraceae bacterium]